ncbi:PTS system mannose/fructose/sorbose family transporter subunit IID, partial [Elusimicrobiota bacterium]
VIGEMAKFKLQMAGPLAAIGDKVFWATWRPLVGIMCILGILTDIKPYYLIPLTFILLYNIPILLQKYSMLKVSYSESISIHEEIKRCSRQFFSKAVPVAGIMLIMSCFIAVTLQSGILRGSMFTGVSLIVGILKIYKKMSATKIFYTVCVLIIIGRMILR